ncbi:MAG: dihydroorotase [Myxococcales bacterium]|nr:dihydroorotase [Myxococcales bacterium]
MTDAQQPFDLLIHGGEVVVPGGRFAIDIGVRAGKIAALGNLGDVAALQTYDAKGLCVLPGIIDAQVHFREPGMEHKEDLASGTAAAVLGGVTSVLEMPNTDPPTISAPDLADKVARAAGRAACDIGFFVGATPHNVHDLDTLEELPACVGVKVFMGSSTGRLLVASDEDLAQVLSHGRRRVALHAEDEDRLRLRKKLAEAEGHVSAHPLWRDVETARLATARAIALAKRYGRRIHILHVTSADEIPLIAGNRDWVTAEVCVQHLTLAAPECYERLGTLAQMNPPIRDASHQEALWSALNEGVFDMVTTDHAPHTLEEEGKPYPQSPSGMPGVQTLLPLMLDHVHQGRLSLEKLVDVLCDGPARVWNIAGKGRIAVGYDADFCIADLAATHTLANRDMASKVGWTPFDGMRVTGKPLATIVRGQFAMRDGQVMEPRVGKPLRYMDTLMPQRNRAPSRPLSFR